MNILRDKKTATSIILFWIELVMADLVVVETQKQSRLSFTCEFKLSMVEWYYDNNNNIIQAANKLKIDIKWVRNYIAGGENIRKQTNKRKIVRSRHAQYSLLEDEILDEFREVRNLGTCIKGWWLGKENYIRKISSCN